MRHLSALAFLSIVLAFAVLNYGGVAAPQWNIALAAICLVCGWTWLPGRTADFAPALPRVALALVLALLAWVGLQLVPIPAAWLKVLSPARYEILQGVQPIHLQTWAPLSVSPRITLLHLLRLLAHVLVFLLIREIAFRLRRRTWLCILPLIAIGAAESAIGLAQHFGNAPAVIGTYANHAHLAGLLEMILPLTLVLIPVGLEKGRRKPGESILTASIVCALLASAALVALGLVYTASRMGLFVAAFSLALLVVMNAGSSRTAVYAALGGLVLLGISAPLSLVSRYEGGLTSEVRLQIWRDTLRLIPNYPMFGCGLGTYVSAVQKYRGATPLQLVDFAHNDYLQLMAELGAVGFAIAMAVVFVAAREILRIVRAESGSAHLIASACFASVAGIAVHSLVDFQFYIPANVMVAAWITGIAAGIGAHRAARH